MQQPTELAIPDFFSLTPFPWGGRNPLFSPDKRPSTEWMLRYGVFSDHKRDRLDVLNAELLGAYAYPYAGTEGLRIASDFVMILFALDEFTDVQDAQGAKATSDIFVNALTGKSGDDNSPVTLFTKDFMIRLSNIASPQACERFVSGCISYIEATAKEASLRVNGEVPSFEEYTRIRRHNGGVFPAFDLIEAALGVTLPAGVFEDPNFQRVRCSLNDMTCLANDIYSYAMEYARGIDEVNVVTAIKHEKGVSLQEAVDFVAGHYKDLGNIVTSCKENICTFGPEADEAIRSYIYGMEQWVYGSLVWSFDMPRYFGERLEEVKRTKVVKLTQRKSLE